MLHAVQCITCQSCHGRAQEFIEFDKQGNAKQRSSMGAPGASAAVGDDLLEEFGDFGWEQFMEGAMEEDEQEEAEEDDEV